MGRSPCCAKEGLNRGAWTASEDRILTEYIKAHGEGKWRNVPKKAGLKRCGKSCRLRWLNYLRPDIKRGNISRDEEELIIRLHKLLGNRWSLIAGRLPGRTDNEIKNYWNTNIGKRFQDHHQTNSSSGTRRASYQYRGKANFAVEKKSPSKSLKTDSKDSNLIWTKASKCNKVVISPLEPQNFDQDHQVIDSKQLAAGAGGGGGGGGSTVVLNNNNNEEDVHYNVKGGGEALPEFNFQENNQSDFMIDLQMDEHLLSFLNSDFSQLSYFENSINNGGPSSSPTISNSCYKGPLGDDPHPKSNETLLFCEEKKKLHDSDFPLMDSLIGSEFEWFQD